MVADGIGGERETEQRRDMQRLWIALGALVGCAAVAMAALAAHAFAHLEPPALAMLRSAVQMQGWHALALLGVGLWAPRGGRLADTAGAAFVLGALLFCGGVYSTALGGPLPGGIAPIGGTLLMLGWLVLAASAIFARRAV
jgi:uncharacterized membrane protein YgdD (TMEM256/DUF423 family)